MSVNFNKAAVSKTIQNPVFQNRYIVELFQTKGRATAGDLYVYDKGASAKYRLFVQFDGLRDSEKADLESFFVDTAEGMLNTFTYTDHEGTQWTAQFLTDTLEFICIDDWYSSKTTFSSGGSSYPTTTREEPVWRVEFEMEVEEVEV